MHTFTVAEVRALAAQVAGAGADAAARARWARTLQSLERRAAFTRASAREFQALLAHVGARTRAPIAIPADDQPYWFRAGTPLAAYQSQTKLPQRADVVIIGAGLTGTAAAYHLASEAARLRVVVIDQGDPAGEASGRNGGNFQLLPENSVGAYEGLAKERFDFLRRRYRAIPIEILHAESERQASLVLGIARRNRDLLKSIILHEHIECDFSPRGWLHMACSEEEEQGMCDEVMLGARHGQRLEIWSRGRIRQEFGIDTAYLGRFIPGDGTYHPYRYAHGLLRSALDAGVELYTRTAVQQVQSARADRHHVRTARGTITARRVIVATNAFTRLLFPELAAIQPRQSQIMLTEHAPDRTRGRAITCDDGPAFFNQPRAGAVSGHAPLLMGGGADRPMRNPHSRRRSARVHTQLLALRDRFFPELRGCPPSAEWVGAMGFTPDELPAIGFLRPGVVIAAGYNGYGGSYTTAAGSAAAEIVMSGAAPSWVPEDVFSPRRLLASQPMFMTDKSSLSRISHALSTQLRVVNEQIIEAIELGGTAQLESRQMPRRNAAGALNAAGAVTAEELHALDEFSAFADQDVRALARMLTRTVAVSDAVLFRAGSTDASWYIVLHGTVSVTLDVRGRHHLIASLPAGSILGHPGAPEIDVRMAICTIARGTVLAEIDPAAWNRLLQRNSSAALKLLTLVNQQLAGALRAADRRLLQLDTAMSGNGTAHHRQWPAISP